MALIRTIALARLATRDQIANTKSTNAILGHVKMEEHALITITTIRAIVPTDLPEKTALNMSIGVHRIHAKTALLVHNVKTPTNANV